MKKKRKLIISTAFSMAEMSVVLLIISFILGASYSFIKGNYTLARQNSTEEKMRIIEKAIAGFFANNLRLPCGGNLNLADDSSTNSGAEYCYSTGCAGTYVVNIASPPTSPTSYSGNNTNVMIGSVPYQALGLSKEFLADEWGNDFIYAYTQSLAGNNSSCVYGLPTTTWTPDQTNMGLVIVEDATNAQRTNQAAYVLMSTGANGLGGFPKNATSRTAAPTNANELINYNSTGNATFVAQERTYVTDGLTSSNTFDDIVHYRMKWQLVKDAGMVIYNSSCTSVFAFLKQLETAYSGLYYDQENYYQANCLRNPGDSYCDSYFNTILYKLKEMCVNAY